ncbi:hypothetical protein Tco_1218832, partial [Tanacetum coccineum]
MAGLNFADSHNMVAYMEKSIENANSTEIVDILNANPISSKSTDWNEFGTNIASAVICLATNQKFKFSKLIFDDVNVVYDTPSHNKKVFANMIRKGKEFSSKVTPLFETMLIQQQAEVGEGLGHPTDPQHTSITASPSQVEPITVPSSYQPKTTHRPRKAKRAPKIFQYSRPISLVADETVIKEWEDKMERAATTASILESNDPPLSRVNTLGSGEDRLKLKELMDLCTKLSDRFLDLEITKTAQAKEIASLKKRVKKLEGKRKLKPQGMKRLFKIGRFSQVVSSKDEGLGDQEDESKQGRKIADIDADAEEVSTAKVVIGSATTTVDELTLAQTLMEIKAAKPKAIGVI